MTEFLFPSRYIILEASSHLVSYVWFFSQIIIDLLWSPR